MKTGRIWICEIGVTSQQERKERAEYGSALLQRLSKDLTKRFGRGFGIDNLQRMRAFYLEHKPETIYATLSRNSGGKIHYALEGLPNKILASEYQIALPKEKDLAEELAKTRNLLELRKFTGKKEATKLNMQYWI